MARIVKKLVTKAKVVRPQLDQGRTKTAAPGSAAFGTLIPRTSNVMAMAKTPSLNASMRPVSFRSRISDIGHLLCRCAFRSPGLGLC